MRRLFLDNQATLNDIDPNNNKHSAIPTAATETEYQQLDPWATCNPGRMSVEREAAEAPDEQPEDTVQGCLDPNSYTAHRLASSFHI